MERKGLKRGWDGYISSNERDLGSLKVALVEINDGSETGKTR